MGLAFLQEELEHAIYHYRFEWPDCIADTAGLLVALFIVHKWQLDDGSSNRVEQRFSSKADKSRFTL